MVVSIIGGSGSGKDTQAELLSKRYDVPNISTGNIMRAENRKGNPLAIQAMESANQGKWVPDEIINQILTDYVRANCPKGFIITGYPRRVAQVEALESIASALGQKVLAAIHIQVPDEVLIGRMRSQAEEAMEAGDERSDTDDEIMLARLNSYHETIDPILAEYTQGGILVNVDGTASIEDVHDTIFTHIESIKTK